MQIEIKDNGNLIDHVNVILLQGLENKGTKLEYTYRVERSHDGLLMGFITHNSNDGPLVLAVKALKEMCELMGKGEML